MKKKKVMIKLQNYFYSTIWERYEKNPPKVHCSFGHHRNLELTHFTRTHVTNAEGDMISAGSGIWKE
jgi:hypothetical protein